MHAGATLSRVPFAQTIYVSPRATASGTEGIVNAHPGRALVGSAGTHSSGRIEQVITGPKTDASYSLSEWVHIISGTEVNQSTSALDFTKLSLKFTPKGKTSGFLTLLNP